MVRAVHECIWLDHYLSLMVRAVHECIWLDHYLSLNGEVILLLLIILFWINEDYKSWKIFSSDENSSKK